MAHRYRMYPTATEAEKMVEWCAQARFVWNLALEQRNYWRPGMPRLSGYDQKRQLTEARNEFPWFKAGPTVVQQQAVLDLDQAFKNWWGGSHRRPTWRRAGANEGFAIRDVTVRRLNRRWATVLVPKLGHVRFRLHRPMPSQHGMGRVTLDRSGRWHVSFSSVEQHDIVGDHDGSMVRPWHDHHAVNGAVHVVGQVHPWLDMDAGGHGVPHCLWSFFRGRPGPRLLASQATMVSCSHTGVRPNTASGAGRPPWPCLW